MWQGKRINKGELNTITSGQWEVTLLRIIDINERGLEKHYHNNTFSPIFFSLNYGCITFQKLE